MQHTNDINNDKLSSDMADLALLFTTDLYVGAAPIHLLKTQRSKPFWVRYEIDGWVQERSYLSVLSWRALMLYVLLDRKIAIVHEMDERGRLGQLFPTEIKVRLNWNAAAQADVLPVARFYDPNGSAQLILTRSRCLGHAVDVLHNLTEAGPVFQPVWVADLFRLKPMIGLNLARDETFQPTQPISAYLEAAAMTGRLASDAELSKLPLTGIAPRLVSPTSTKTTQRIFEDQCRKNPELSAMVGRTIYEDYTLSAVRT
jgi:Protein of unknown function (DUF2958)